VLDPAGGLLFTELNEHLRANDSKQLQISIGYFTLLAIALSILASNAEFAVSWPHLVTYGVLITVGCMTVYVQDAFRSWKIHYRVLGFRLMNRLGLNPELCPLWMSTLPYRSPHKFSLSPDNALTYFTAGTTTTLMVIFDVIVVKLLDSRALAISAAVTASAIYTTAIVFVWLRARRRKHRVCADTEGDVKTEPATAVPDA
jgi:hypothetical protein